jgi:hypothetical protein
MYVCSRCVREGDMVARATVRPRDSTKLQMRSESCWAIELAPAVAAVPGCGLLLLSMADGGEEGCCLSEWWEGE